MPPLIGAYCTTITYFFHEGTLYSDAIAVPVAADAVLGYTAVSMDDIVAGHDDSRRIGKNGHSCP